MNAASKARGFGIALYGIAAVLVVPGVILNVTGSVRTGTNLIGYAIVFTVSAALRLGHLKRW